MGKYIATVNFAKMVQHDNFDNGCSTNSWITSTDDFVVSFTDTNDFKEKLADWIVSHFDVDRVEFMEYVNNECDNNRFDYCQNEDGDGDCITITESNPDGYLADYSFHVSNIAEEVDYKF